MSDVSSAAVQILAIDSPRNEPRVCTYFMAFATLLD